MKIEWLNKERTKALLTRGWLRKRNALVHAQVVTRTGHYGNTYKVHEWYYSDTGTGCSDGMDTKLNDARSDAIHRDPWRAVSDMPVARVVK